MLFYYHHISIFMFFHALVFLDTAMHALVYLVACGSGDALQYKTSPGLGEHQYAAN